MYHKLRTHDGIVLAPVLKQMEALSDALHRGNPAMLAVNTAIAAASEQSVVELAELLVAYFQKKDYDLTKLQGSINYDYFNKMLAKGKEKGDMVATAKALLSCRLCRQGYR